MVEVEEHFVEPDTGEVEGPDSVVVEEVGVFDFEEVVILEEHSAAVSEVVVPDRFVVEQGPAAVDIVVEPGLLNSSCSEALEQ